MKKMITFLAFSLQVEIFARVEDETKLAKHDSWFPFGNIYRW